MSKITTVLFDLDGTLLRMDQDEFTKKYFQYLSEETAPDAFKAMAAGMDAMIKNDGTKPNDETFFEGTGEFATAAKEAFDRFYSNGYLRLKDVCNKTPRAKETVDTCKKAGLRVVLATNPVFPLYATEKRICWAGLSPEDFELVTAYENSSHCKPNPDYYAETAKKLGVSPEGCLMVGNDVSEDMVAEEIGMKVFLLTDCIVNRENKDISRYPNGDFDALGKFLKDEGII